MLQDFAFRSELYSQTTLLLCQKKDTTLCQNDNIGQEYI